MQMLKVDLTLKSIYGKDKELSKYMEVFTAQAEVSVECGVNFGGEIHNIE